MNGASKGEWDWRKHFSHRGPLVQRPQGGKSKVAQRSGRKPSPSELRVKGSESQHSRGPGGSDRRLFVQHEAARRRDGCSGGQGPLLDRGLYSPQPHSQPSCSVAL